MLVIFNNPVTAYEAVVDALMAATGCDADEAYLETWEAHHFGQAPVHFDPDASALEGPAAILNRVGVKTEICPEFIS